MVNLKLNPNEFEALLKWIDGYAGTKVDDYVLTRPSKKFSRDFSDGVLLAKILKFEFPKLVILHNYESCNGIKRKMQKWDMLNQKVLTKLKINLKQEEIEKLAKAERGFIEEVLFGIMNIVKQTKAPKQQSKSKGPVCDKKLQSDIMTVIVKNQVGDHVEHIPQQIVLNTIHEELPVIIAELNIKFKQLPAQFKELKTKLDELIAKFEKLLAKCEESQAGKATIDAIMRTIYKLNMVKIAQSQNIVDFKLYHLEYLRKLNCTLVEASQSLSE